MIEKSLNFIQKHQIMNLHGRENLYLRAKMATGGGVTAPQTCIEESLKNKVLLNLKGYNFSYKVRMSLTFSRMIEKSLNFI